MLTKLCLIRDTIKNFCTRNQKLLSPVLKFVVSIFAMYVMTLNLSYMSAVSQWWIILVISLVCAVLPWPGITVVVSVYILINFYAVSWEVMAFMACIYIVMLCTYFIFKPENDILMAIVPIFLWFRLPLLPAIVLAIISTPAGAVPMVFGTIVYYVMMVVRDNSAALATGNMDTVQKLSFMISKVFGNGKMWLVCAVIVLTLFIVFIIKMRRVNYSREIAVVTGTIFGVVTYLAGSLMFNTVVNIPILIIGGIFSMLVGIITIFADVALDYSRTEYVQFEDDDYYYYVKAVPKMSVTRPEFVVKRFDNKEDKEEPVKEELVKEEPVEEEFVTEEFVKQELIGMLSEKKEGQGF